MDIPTEILIKLINPSDIHSWLNFMFVSMDIYHRLYPLFILHKFKFMQLYNQKIPNCVINNYKIKRMKNSSDCHEFFITTDLNYIEGHCQFQAFYLYETYGLFFRDWILVILLQ